MAARSAAVQTCRRRGTWRLPTGRRTGTWIDLTEERRVDAREFSLAQADLVAQLELRTDSAGVILITLLPRSSPPLFINDSEISSTSFNALPAFPATMRNRWTK